MKISIYTKSSEQEWEPIIAEAKPYLKALREDVRVEFEQYNGYTPFVYRPDSLGIMRKHVSADWMKSVAPNDCQVFFVHDPTFEVDGAWGGFKLNASKDKKTLYAWAARPLTATSNRYKEFKLDVARTFVHEILHAKYFLNDLPDRTHYWQEQDNLMGGVEELITARENTMRGMTLRFYLILLKLRDILQIVVNNKNEGCEEEPIMIIHHSATARDWTRKETILKQLDGSGKEFDWYHWIILPDETIQNRTKPHKRGTIDVCVVGDFTKEKPTPFQIGELKRLSKGHKLLTHKEAGNIGLATKSECPGLLMKYYE